MLPRDMDPRMVFFAPQNGVVIDNVDPEGLYRVRVRIPGLIQRSSWAWPRATMGGGSAQRGGVIVPAIGSDVVVTFLGGDPNRPLWEGAWWGKPPAGSEMPTPLRDLPPAEVPRVQCMQVGTVVITFDEREGQRKFSVEDLTSGDSVVLDLEKQGISINATSALILKAVGAVSIDGAAVTINGRVVRATGRAI
ncbi:MAG: hypothetical protein HOW73_43105 [Polyangiaceae bacterium]|nr:hypothetical protein [Polyangiaceae bacterium]